MVSGSASGVMESSDTVTRLQGESASVFQNSSPLASLLLSLKASLAALLQNYLDLGRRIMKRDTGVGNKFCHLVPVFADFWDIGI